MLAMGLAGCRSMTTREDVADAAERWQAHYRKTDTPSETALRQLQASIPGDSINSKTRIRVHTTAQTTWEYVLRCLVMLLEYGLSLRWGKKTALCQGVNFV